jgi:ABC-2 type transport system ATP-binding protein
MSDNAPAIEAVGLVKSFGATRAVDRVDLRVGRGIVYGFLGPNGAGKTTTIRILATLVRPDAGRASVLGHDVVGEADAVRRRVSLTGQFASIDLMLTGTENLVLLARLWGHRPATARRRAAELLDAFGLADAGHRVVSTYSGGMRRRLDIAASIVVTPDLLFLDEPTTGLDPASRRQVWEIVRSLADAGTTVLLTTQYLDEADRLAERMAVIDHGTVVAEGTPAELKAATGIGVLTVRLIDAARRREAEQILGRTLEVAGASRGDSGAITVRVEDQARVPAALAALASAGIALSDFALGQPSLDDVFLALTGHRPVSQTTTEEDAA